MHLDAPFASIGSGFVFCVFIYQEEGGVNVVSVEVVVAEKKAYC